MSFMQYHGKPYLRETREEQFIRYIQETGAAKAIQDSLTLLYRMPIKPTNLTEYFAEYFENGAKDLVALSLLRAELCYKHSETKGAHKRIASLEEQIRELKPFDTNDEPDDSRAEAPKSKDFSRTTGESKEEHGFELSEHFNLSLAEDDEGFERTLMNRFLDDLDVAPRGSAVSSEVSSMKSVDPLQVNRSSNGHDSDAAAGEVSKDLIYQKEAKESSLSEYSDPGRVLPAECIREEPKEMHKSYEEDVKRLDPWGIVCRIPNHPKLGRKDTTVSLKLDHPKMSLHEAPSEKGEMSILTGHGSSGDSDREYQNNYDSDDAETLAEIYQNYAYEEDVNNLSDQKEKRLFVLQPAAGSKNPSLTDLLGWSPVTSARSLNERGNEQKIPLRRQGENQPRQWCGPTKKEHCQLISTKDCKKRNVFWPLEDSYSGESPFKPTKNDSFLLKDESKNRTSLKLDLDGDFMFEFYNQRLRASPENEEKYKDRMNDFCEHMVPHTHRPKSFIRRMRKDVETMTVPMDACPCGDGLCDCEYLGELGESAIRSLRASQLIKQSPGKMSNWTKLSTTYSDCVVPEDYPFGEDEVYLKDCKMRKELEERISKERKRSDKIQQKYLEDYAVQLSPLKSTCDCNDSLTNVPSYVLDECTKYYKEQEKEEILRNSGMWGDKHRRSSMDEGTMTLTDEDKLRGMVPKSELDTEYDLADVFKVPESNWDADGIPYRAGADQTRGAQAGNRRNTDFDEAKNISNAYELDLRKEVKKRLGF